MMRFNLVLTNENRLLRGLRGGAAALGLALAAAGGAALAQDRAAAGQAAAAPAQEGPTYADLVTLAEASELIIRARIRDQVTVPPERAPGLAPGFVRLYLEGEAQALLGGGSGVRESLAWLADVEPNAKGKPPKLAKTEVLLFAESVAGRPGTIVLVDEAGQFAWTRQLEERVRGVLRELVAADAPPRVTGVADALSVRGNLAGESETQIFLETTGDSPASISVLRRPGQPPAWGVSWGEIIDSAARRPEPDTLQWYRLACALPAELPSSANLARDPAARALAEEDYALVRAELGECGRRVTEAR
ncbi:hypothetical protein SAMN04515621_1958 [Erythrobacter sp. HL-111]|nr:MAG: hypothetical protein HLUCCO15_05370 [Erythrobacteraceae bacterium HL-111]SDS65109.1 hypothetical protein SAMN04515621_1958 [Erythrobacter sp. HL-111]